MRKTVLWMSVSLDGYVSGPDGEIDWHMVDDEVHAYVNGVLQGAGAFLSGRVTYELMADFWPTADQDPASTSLMAEFAGIWRDMPKIVYSKTMQSADWNTTIAREVVPEEVRSLQAQPGGDLVISGADLAASFMEANLIDEYRIFIHPVVIGGGKPLFPQSQNQLTLELIESRRFGNGVVGLHYRRIG